MVSTVGGLAEPDRLDAMHRFFDTHYPAGVATTQHFEMGAVAQRDERPLHSSVATVADTGQCNPSACLLVADVRLDNREELATKLSISAAKLPSLSNAALVLAAYDVWGECCPAHLLGDFAFALWDAERQRLFCARDHLGIKPLFFAYENGAFVFASDAEAVATHPRISAAISEVSVARFLGEGDLYDERETMYRSVFKLPSAYWMIFDANGVREHRYWRPEQAPFVRYAKEQEYIDHLRDLLERSVVDRLPEDNAIGSHLSGGLDSSAITAIAGRNLSGKSQTLHSWSWMPAPTTDEQSANIEWKLGLDVAQQSEAIHHFTEFDARSMLSVLEMDLLRRNDTVDLFYEFPLRQIAKQKGVSVILSGWGGDQFISHHGYYRHAETFWHGRVISTLRDIWRESKLEGGSLLRFGANSVRGIVLPVLPARLNGRLRQARLMQHQFLACASDEFSQFALQQMQNDAPYLGNCIRVDQLRYMQQRKMFSRIDSWAVSGARSGIDYRYPLLDKRVIEFALGIPAEMYRSRGYDRYLMRRAMQHWLPNEVCFAHSKAEPQRVVKLYSQIYTALQQWAQSGSELMAGRISGRKTIDTIEGLSAPGETVKEADVIAAMSVIKAIYVAKL